MRGIQGVIGLSLCLGIGTSVLAKGSRSLGVMFYNTYNLFDAEHDEGKNDWTFLPKGFPGKDEYCETMSNSRYRKECMESDWNEDSVKLKISQLKKAVIKTTNGKLPDVLGLCEVENKNVVSKFAKSLGYSTFKMSTSPDKRGIDVALLYKSKKNFRYVGMDEHEIQPMKKGERPTRNILEVEFNYADERVLVFVNHWPSQAAPAPVRENVAKQALSIINDRIADDASVNIILMGDFNVVKGDYPHPFKGVLMNPKAKNTMIDVHDLYAKSSAPREEKGLVPHGTYFYPPKFSWDRLDRFFVNAQMADGKGLEVDAKSYKILNDDSVSSTYKYSSKNYANYGSVITGIPYRANINATDSSDAGYSDHFPIYVELVSK